jgi:hypothetical protein
MKRSQKMLASIKINGYSIEQLSNLHKQSIHNKALINGKIVSCFYCMRTFTSQMVIKYVDENDTAICPFCGIDSVLPVDHYPLQEAMHKFYFSQEYSEKIKNSLLDRFLNLFRKDKK